MKSNKGRFCTRCGEENFSFAKYCSGCGYEIPDIIFKEETIIPKIQKNTKSIDVESKSSKESSDKVIGIIEKYAKRLISVAWIFILVFTNPSEEKHLRFAKEKIYEKAKVENSKYGAILGVFELFVGQDRTDILMKTFVKRKNYFVFSLTVVSIDNKSYIIGVGVLDTLIDLEKVEYFLTEYL